MVGGFFGKNKQLGFFCLLSTSLFNIIKLTSEIRFNLENRKGFMEKITALYAEHQALQAKMVDFAGFQMPIQYPTGIIAEHLAVRNQVGMFDVSHMGEILVKGPAASKFLDYVLTSKSSSLTAGGIKYGLLCQPDGGVIDDLLVYCLSDEAYLLVVNASNIAKDYQWLKDQAFSGVEIIDKSSDYSVIAVQGPSSLKVLSEFWPNLPKKRYTFQELAYQNEPCLISKTGYTGEAGYEIYLPNALAPVLWQALLAKEVLPCGLGARDTLRLEAGLPLYGQELSAKINPLEAGLGYFVDFSKADFIGKAALMAPVNRKLIAFRLDQRLIARALMPVYQAEVVVGEVTSGTYSPSLKAGIGLALVEITANLTKLSVNIRNHPEPLIVVDLPFIKK